MAKLNGVDKNTVSTVYYRLVSKGWLIYSHGSRTRVSFNRPTPVTKHLQEDKNLPEYLIADFNNIKEFWPVSIQDFIAIGPETVNDKYSADDLISKYAKKFREQKMESSLMQKVMEDSGSVLTNSVIEHLNLTRGFQT